MSTHQGVMRSIGSALLILLLVAIPFFRIPVIHAANFQQAYARFDRMKASVSGNVLIVLKPATVAVEAKVLVTFPAGFTVSATPTINTTNLPAGVTALPGTLTIAGSGQIATVSSVTDLTVGTLYGFNIATGITNTVAGIYTTNIATQTGASAAIDSTDVATRSITDDQIVITAVVPPSFSFTLSGNTDTFTGNLDSSAIVSTAGKTVTIATNASQGWICWVKSLNAGLNSATTSQSIATAGSIDGSPSTLTAGTNGYVLDTDLTTDSATGTGVVTIDPEYNGTGTTQGGTLSTLYQPIASATGTTNGDVLTLIERVAISAVAAAAADYTDTLTVIGAGRF
jgi:hypothetical protein